MRATLIGASFAAAAACGDIPSTTEIPNLFGFATAAISDRPSQSARSRMSEWRTPDDNCVGNLYGAIAVTGDVLGTGDQQTVFASYDHVVVIDAAGALVAATTTDLECAGSADSVDIVAIGKTWLDTPAIAIAATVGGRAEHQTYVSLYRVHDHALVPLFTGAVLAKENDDTWVGSITLVPNGLLYRAPGDPPTWWIFDRERGRYIEQAPLPTPETPRVQTSYR